MRITQVHVDGGDPYAYDVVQVFKGNKLISQDPLKESERGSARSLYDSKWSPDSRFFVFLTKNVLGHSIWHSPTTVYDTVTNKFVELDDEIGAVVDDRIDFVGPDTLQIKVMGQGDDPTYSGAVTKVVALASTNANAHTLDDGLNAAYHQALASKHIEPDWLQWVEQKWIIYRDAEANLQGWIVGKNHTDAVARQSALDALTITRTAELKHIAASGTSGDLSKSATMGSDHGVAISEDAVAAVQIYASLKSALISRHNPNLLAALILSQKAWLTFSDLQADYDLPSNRPVDLDIPDSVREAAAARLQRLRTAQLQADAAALGIALKPDSDTATQGNLDLYTEVSPDQSLRVEQEDGGGPVATASVFSNETGAHAPLPVTEDEKGSGREGPTVEISEFSISPDNDWIFRAQKFYHGMCGAYLYQKVSGQTYRAATPQPFDILAWKFFEKATRIKLPDVKGGGVVRLVKWSPDGVRFSLNAKETLESGSIGDWQAEYNFSAKAFSIPSDVREHDREAIYP